MMIEFVPYMIMAGVGCMAVVYALSLWLILVWMRCRLRHHLRDVRIHTIRLSRQMVLRAGMFERQFFQLQLSALQDHDTAVQHVAVQTLGSELERQQEPPVSVFSRTASRLNGLNVMPIIPIVLQILGPDQRTLRHAANTVLKACVHEVYTVVFGAYEDTVIPILRNPDVRHLTIPFPHLKQVVIDLDTCDFSLVTSFTRYMRRILGVQYLKHSVTVQISGNLAAHALDAYNPLADCHAVYVGVERIVFGASPDDNDSRSFTLYNPDFSTCRLPLRNLKYLIIQPATCQFHTIERFLTYAINYIGQTPLKHSVDVYVDGKLEQLHPNLRNGLTNLCRRVYEGSP